MLQRACAPEQKPGQREPATATSPDELKPPETSHMDLTQLPELFLEAVAATLHASPWGAGDLAAASRSMRTVVKRTAACATITADTASYALHRMPSMDACMQSAATGGIHLDCTDGSISQQLAALPAGCERHITTCICTGEDGRRPEGQAHVALAEQAVRAFPGLRALHLGEVAMRELRQPA